MTRASSSFGGRAHSRLTPEAQADRFNKWADEKDIRERPLVAPTGGFLLPSNDVSISDSARALYSIIAPKHRIFTRGKAIVTLQKTMNGEPVLEPLQPSAARSLFEEFANIYAVRSYRAKAPAVVRATMPEDTARALLNCHVATEILPPIRGLVNCPVLTDSNGALRTLAKGYDPATGLFVMRGRTPADVSLGEAVAALKTLLGDFQFETAGDCSRAMSAFLSPALKMGDLLTEYVPADVAEADQSQSGKTYRQRLSAAIYGEQPAIVALKKGGVGSVDESFYEKLVNGRAFIQFDNFRGMLDSPALESFLTSETFSCRIPHCREIEVDPKRFFIQLSSNGVETTRDFANRSCIVRIRKREGIQFPNTLQLVRDNQPYYLGCVFSLVREWFRQGKPQTNDTRHAFHQWCGILDWIVQDICGMAPLMDGHVEAQVQVSNPTLTFLRQVALEIERQCRLEEEMTALHICEVAQTAGVTIPGLRQQQGADDEKGSQMVGMKLAPLFKNGPRIEVGGFTIERTEQQQSREGGGSFAKKFYRFSKMPQK